MKPSVRQKVNTTIDLIMLVVMVALAVIGFLIRYSLLSGVERWEKFGRNVEMTFLGLDRHQWGDVHLILGISLAVLLILHILIHWAQIVCMVKRLFPRRIVMVMVVSTLTILCSAILLAPFVFSPKIGEPIRGHGDGYGRMISGTNDEESFTRETKEVIAAKEEPEAIIDNRKVSVEKEVIQDEARIFEIRGYHTFEELAATYEVTASEMKRKLNLPATVSNNERLGRIRRIYGFTMRDVEDCIIALQQAN